MQLQSLPSIVKSSLSMTLPKVLLLPTAGEIVIIIQSNDIEGQEVNGEQCMGKCTVSQ